MATRNGIFPGSVGLAPADPLKSPAMKKWGYLSTVAVAKYVHSNPLSAPLPGPLSGSLSGPLSGPLSDPLSDLLSGPVSGVQAKTASRHRAH